VNLKVIFELDGTGVVYSPSFPLHLDGLLEWAAMPIEKIGIVDRNSDDIFHPEIPVEKWKVGDTWGWKASALFPEPERHPESIQYWRKKFRQNRSHLLGCSFNTMSGAYREYNMPMVLCMCNRMIAYVRGEKCKIKTLLEKIKYLGKKGSYGKGRVNNIRVRGINHDWSIEKDGRYMRFFPKKDGVRFGRVRPPYWNTTNRLQTCYVGDAV